jgi:predicted transcriptional regulator
VRIDDELYYALTAISQSKQKSKSVIARDYLVDGVVRERKNPTYSFSPSNASLHA